VSVVLCPDGLSNSPAHFLNLVDSRCVPYSRFQLFLFAGGCVLWVVAYAIIVRNAFRLRFVDMAAIAGFSNFAWEFVWSWPNRTDMGWFLVYTYRAWWLLDILIIWKTFEFGAEQFPQDRVRRHFRAIGVVCIAGFGILYYFFVRQGLDEPIGATSAYICQLILSWACLWVLVSFPAERRFSMWVAVLKGYGTAMNTWFMFLHYPENHLVQALGTIAFGIDNLYIVLLHRRLGSPASSHRSGGIVSDQGV